MPRTPNRTCDVCDRLYRIRMSEAPHQEQYLVLRNGEVNRETVSYGGLLTLGNPGPVNMRRLYVKERGIQTNVGYICEAGHVVLDDSPGEGRTHLVTRTKPAQVICLALGEVVSTELPQSQQRTSELGPE